MTNKEFYRSVIDKIWGLRIMEYASLRYEGETLNVLIILTTGEQIEFKSEEKEINFRDFASFRCALHEEATGCGLKHNSLCSGEIFNR